MHLKDLYKKKSFVFSIEIFPPKTKKGEEKLKAMLGEFKSCTPDYISVTYGAGGSSRENTHELAAHINNDLGVPAMAHLTCVSHSVKEIEKVLTKLKTSCIENVMALRGDPPAGTDHFVQTKDGFQYASELIEVIKDHSEFGICAAGYPEGHVENLDKEDDKRHLHEKITAGAEFIVTQFFLDNTYFLQWRDQLRKEGISVPLVAGILPPASWKAIKYMSDMCGVSIPNDLAQDLKKNVNNPEVSRQIGFDHVERQIEELLSEEVDGVHLYALNHSETVKRLGSKLKDASRKSIKSLAN